MAESYTAQERNATNGTTALTMYQTFVTSLAVDASILSLILFHEKPWGCLCESFRF